MLALVSAGAAETANGAVKRRVLLGLTSRIISNFVARFLLAAKNAKADDLRSGDIYTVKHIQKGPTLLFLSATFRPLNGVFTFQHYR